MPRFRALEGGGTGFSPSLVLNSSRGTLRNQPPRPSAALASRADARLVFGYAVPPPAGNKYSSVADRSLRFLRAAF